MWTESVRQTINPYPWSTDRGFLGPSPSYFFHDKYCFVHDFLGSNDFLEYFFVVFFSKTRGSKIIQMIFLKENE